MKKQDQTTYDKRAKHLREYKEQLEARLAKPHRCDAPKYLCGPCWMIGFYRDHIFELEHRIAEMEKRGIHGLVS